jgi:glyoxylase-like metal-dependent hydrolase (beta-lactamase superfamily II)
MATLVKTLDQLLIAGESQPDSNWCLKSIQNEECFSYIAWNSKTREALLIDPKKEELETYRQLIQELKDLIWLGVIDTHTHADHVSIAYKMAEELKVPLMMHSTSLCTRAALRVSQTTSMITHAGPIQFIPTPGHTPDSMTVIWGPFLFGGDTFLFGDVGRDDLPGGSPEAHFESIQVIKKIAQPHLILLPGHDHKGGRASTWATQLKLNSSLNQGREDFIQESAAFDAPAPKLLKESLRENFK